MANNVVGTAYVRLRLLTDSIGKDIGKSVEGIQGVDIKVKADTGEADAKLAATSAQADKLGSKSPTIKPKVDSKDAEKNLGLLSTAIVDLVPLVGPFAGAATAAFAGAAAGAGVALLAFEGIKDQMKEGTKVGQVYSEGLKSLKNDLDVLGGTAAKGVLAGFQTSVHEINTVLPNVNKEVAGLSAVLGDLGGHVVVGLVRGLLTFEPLMTHVVTLADQASIHFEKWASGPGGAKFGADLGRSLDEVVPVLANLVKAVERLVTAAGPLGSTILSGFGLLTKLILALPMPVLQALILGVVTLKTALTGLAIIDKVSNSFDAFSKKAEKAGITTTAGKFTALGAAGTLAGAALFGLSEAMNENAKEQQQIAQLTQAYTTALEDSHGAITQQVTDLTIQNTLTPQISAALTKVGVSTQEWINAIQQGGPAFDALRQKLFTSISPARLFSRELTDAHDAFKAAQAEAKTFTDAQSAANKALAQANPHLAEQAKTLGVTVQAYQDAQTQLTKKTEADAKANALTKLEIDQNYQLTGTQKILSDMYGITTTQVQGYAAMLGITQDQVKSGAVSADAYDRAVRDVADAYRTADQAGAGFLAALDTFSKSAGTAADRAALIGATLKAANGDALDYASSINGAAVAHDQLVQSLDSAAQSVGKNGESVRALVSSIVDLKTGTIDYTKAAAQPLIQGLQGIQDAAMKAAEAQYQHEVGTKGAKKAADDAYTTYVNQTRGTLVDEATKLGLTKDQAKKLADQYFGMPKDVKTRIEQEGADPIVQVLNKIGQQLAYLTHRPWTPKITADTQTAKNEIGDIQKKIDNLHGKDVPINLKTSDQRLVYLLNIQTGVNKRGQNLASGGGVNEGWFTVGEGNPNTWELGYKAGSDVQIFSNKQAKAMTGMQNPPGYAAGSGINIDMASDRVIGSLLNGIAVKIPGLGPSAPVGALQQYALSLFPSHGWGPEQFSPLKSLWNRESGWRVTATNPSSGAYGIAQALPPSKYASAGPDWRNNGQTQIRWGEDYIGGRYGSPAAAWAHELANNWYRGGTPGAKRLAGYATGTRFASQARSLTKQAVAIRFTIDERDLYSLDKALSGSAARIANVLHKLTLDLTRAAAFGGGTALLRRIESDNSRLVSLAARRDRLTAQLAAANAKLAGLRQAAATERGTVASAVMGGFNITTAGQFQVGSGTYSNAAGILGNLQVQVGQARRFASQLAVLRHRGLRADLLQQLGEAGYQTAGPNVAALAGASAMQLRQINAAYHQLGVAGNAAGTVVAGALFGKQIAATQAVVRAISQQRNATVAAINSLERRIDYLARALANRPVRLVANGRELAKLVNDQNKANARR